MQGREELLQDDQPGERSQCLIFKLQLGQRKCFTLDFRFAMLHQEPPCGMVMLDKYVVLGEVLFVQI